MARTAIFWPTSISVFGATKVIRTLEKFLREESGQDLIEYVLLLGFIVLASGALFIHSGDSVHGVWKKADHSLNVANKSVTPRRRDRD